MTALVTASATVDWNGAYPFAISTPFDAAGADLLLVFAAVTSNHAWDPTCAFAGTPGTLLERANGGTGTLGSMWVFAIPAPPSGEGTLTIGNPAEYAGDGSAYVVALSGSNPAQRVGHSAITLGGTSAASSFLTEGDGSAIISLAHAVQVTTISAAGTPEPALLVANTTAINNRGRLLLQEATEIGSTVSLTSTVAFNYTNLAVVEVMSTDTGPRVRAEPLTAAITLGAASVTTPAGVGASPLSATASLGAVTVRGGATTLPMTLAPGEALRVALRFSPSAGGARSGSLSVTSNVLGSPHALPLAGTGNVAPVTLKRLHTEGNQFVTSDSQAIRLASTNWHGAEGENFIPHGCWVRPWRGMLDEIKSFGFNCVRLPFSGAWGQAGLTPPTTAYSLVHNPDLADKTVLQIIDMMLDYCAEIGLYVVLDHHRRQYGAGADGGPIDATYTEANWLATWGLLATRWASHPAVVGADLHNEPHNLEWDAWATLAESCGNHILGLAPDWLIFVEGVGHIGDDHYWWGGQLAGVATRPVVLNTPGRLVYSPHEYGQSVGSQTWLATDGSTPEGWPANLYGVWRPHWGFIYEENIAPIWIGEMGGFFGLDGAGALTKPHRIPETTWMTELVKYLNGSFTSGATPAIPAGKKGMSFAWWTYPPLSGDTGGLLRDDWTTPQQPKLDLIAPILNA